MIKVRPVIVSLICLSILASCATMQQPVRPTHFVSEVDSLARPDANEKRRYVISPGSKNVEETDLQFLEYAGYAEKILNGRGFVKATAFTDADIVVFLSYGIGDPQTHQYSYSMPVWGQTGVSSSTTRGTASTLGNMATYSATTTYSPTYGVTGYTNHDASETTYTRFLLMDAYDVGAYKRGGKMSQVWKTNALSSGAFNDLRRVLPYMAVAMAPFIATNTGRKVEVDVLEGDYRASQLR